MTMPRSGWRVAAWLAAAGLGLLLAAAGAVLIALDRLGPPPIASAEAASVVVLDRKGRLLRPFATADGRWRLEIAPERVDPRYLSRLVAYEDNRFWRHHGVDPLAVARAAWQLVRNGRVVSGASTLTMQVARLLEPGRRRSVPNKLREMLRAFQLEARLTKREILALYLKLAPFGGNLEGLRAASLAYFGKEPYRLALHETALLVALPQSPERRRPDRFAAAARKARDRVLDRAVAAGKTTAAEAGRAKARPVPDRRRPFPMLAPHLAQAEVARRPDLAVHTLTIDRDVQAALETLARERARRLGPLHSVAILALDHGTGEVLAHVGSAGFLDDGRFGQIDMTRPLRSPGSALKPFIYGLAFEAGLAHPETLIEDRPIRFGSYAPRNFDKAYQGTVTVREALQLSLNVPAVQVLHAVGPARLLARLRAAGASLSVARADDPGLAIALGGVGIRLADLAALYAAVARGGEVRPLRTRFEAPQLVFGPLEQPARLLDPVAAWYVASTLRGTPPPENAAWDAIAFKTGTSYGYRDAWAAGFDGRHTIAVWTGRPDGAPAPGLTGINAAAPILHDAFARLGPGRAPFAPAPARAITESTAALPIPLRLFRGPGGTRARGADGPRIAFPPAGARVELAARSGLRGQEVALKAEGGALPLTWFVNGAPLDSTPRRRNAFWRPDGRGFVRLTVVDGRGRTDSVVFRVDLVR